MEVLPPCSTLQASRGGEERCKPGRRSRGAKEASWGCRRGFPKRVKGRVKREDLWKGEGVKGRVRCGEREEGKGRVRSEELRISLLAM